jgi:carboxylesterase type B
LKGESCVQLLPRVGLNLLGDEDFQAYAPVLNEAITTVLSYTAEVFVAGDEDCLYLDVYVPGKAVKDTKLRLPVVNWIYGGGVSDSVQRDIFLQSN